MKTLLKVIAVFLLICGIALAVFLALHRQNLKSRAGNEVTKLTFLDVSGSEITTTSNRDVKVKLTYVQLVSSASATPSAQPSPSSPPITEFPFTRQWGINWEKLPVGSYTLSFTYDGLINNASANLPNPTTIEIKGQQTTQVIVDPAHGIFAPQEFSADSEPGFGLLRVETNPAAAVNITVAQASVSPSPSAFTSPAPSPVSTESPLPSPTCNFGMYIKFADITANGPNEKFVGLTFKQPGSNEVFKQFDSIAASTNTLNYQNDQKDLYRVAFSNMDCGTYDVYVNSSGYQQKLFPRVLVDGDGNNDPEVYLTDGLLQTESNVQGAETSVFPSKYKIANSILGLAYAREESFNENDLTRDWRLSAGDGLKAVYVEFKVGENWSIAFSANITLTNTPVPTFSEYGMNIDIRDVAKIPTTAQVDLLKPKSVRFVFPCTNSLANNNGCPTDYHSENHIAAIPSGIKKIAIINGESTWNAPVTTQAMMVSNPPVDVIKPWTDYLDNVYLPTLQKIVTDYGSDLDAIEIWNEPDVNAGANYNPSVPPLIYNLMLDMSSGVIRSINPKVEILTGGLASGNMTNYLLSLYALDSGVFAGIDGISLHPYKTPDNIATLTSDLTNLRTALQEKAINKPFWITEIGIQNYPEKTTSPKNQKEFMSNVFEQLRVMSPPPQSILWYSFTDLMSGGDGSTGWGLVNSTGAVKPVGELFVGYSTLPYPSPSASPQASPSMVGTALPSPIPSPSPSPKEIKNPDLNGDGKVNAFDVAIFIQKYTAKNFTGLDLNQDGKVNTFDFAYIKKSINI